MLINTCLILAAGFGTRMGKIGQRLPKVLWPVFEKSLLELQVAYARSLGIQNIYINLHYMGEAIEAYCKNVSAFEGVTFLWEKPDILDIGGAIHQLASRPEINYQGRLLVLNADQFFYLSKEQFDSFVKIHDQSKCLLFNYLVNTSQGYNAVEIDQNRIMKGIVKNKELPPSTLVETYTGISIIDLGQLKPVPGVSGFFESVCLYQKDNIPTVLLSDIDYWDFGTLQRYWQTCFRILKTYKEYSNHPFLRFLVSKNALKTWKIDLNKLSYHASGAQVINLASEKLVGDFAPSIILNNLDKTPLDQQAPTIYWRDLHDEVR